MNFGWDEERQEYVPLTDEQVEEFIRAVIEEKIGEETLDNLTELLNNIYLHVTMCFPKVVIKQETTVSGYAALSEDLGDESMAMIASESVSIWSATCTQCGWSDSVIMQDNIPSWEELPEGGENEDPK